MEMTLEEWNGSKENSFRFNNSLLNHNADWDSFPGYMRNSGLGTFDSFFSGIGSEFAKNTSFGTGISLAGASLFTAFTSQAKSIPFLSSSFSLFNFGGRLVRAPLHIFDSAFSVIGETGAGLTLPAILAGVGSAFGLSRVLSKNDSKDFKLPNTTIGGTLGRTSVHHLESMLASKASALFTESQATGAFLATSLTTFGLSTSKPVKETKLPFRTFEGLASQGGFHFLDSLFANIAKTITTISDSPLKVLLGGIALSAGLPFLSEIKGVKNFKASYSKFGGRLIRSTLHLPETLVYNAGNIVGKSILGLPLSLGFAGLTAFSSFSKQGKNLFKNFKIPIGTLGGQFKRVPFDFIYSVISGSALKLSRFIPAPLLLLIGPALSFQIGEKFKNVKASYTEVKGLMVRNTVHLWETLLSNAAYRTGKMVAGMKEDKHVSSGSVLSDGRWLTDEGQIVPSMAIGKQMNHDAPMSLTKTILGAIGGLGFGLVLSMLGKNLNQKTAERFYSGKVLKEVNYGNSVNNFSRV